MHLIRLAALGVVALVGMPVLAGCGAKSGLHASNRSGDAGDAGDAGDGGPGDAGPDTLTPCASDDECVGLDPCRRDVCREGVCAPGQPVLCDDGDECTADQCDPTSGECVFEPLTRDEDDDGYFGPRPGFAAGEPGSCGDDCDDTSAAAHPGGQEICDGVDNDCNGIIDDNMRYEPSGQQPVRVSTPEDRHGISGGIAFDGTNYGVSFMGQRAVWKNLFKILGADGSTVVEAKSLPRAAGDVFSVGPVVWTGSAFASAWEDPTTTGGYEIYFNRLDQAANKLGPDVQVSSRAGYSLDPELLWNGSEFLVFWQEGDFDFSLFARRLGPEGSPLGSGVQVSGQADGAKNPSVAEGTRRLGLVFLQAGIARIGFRSVAPDLSDTSDTVILSGSGAAIPEIVFSGDRFVVVWDVKEGTPPGPAIWGAVLDESGNILVPARTITSGTRFAQTPTVLALGDRVILIWADYRDGNYELYSKMLGVDLREQSPPQRITFDDADTLGPAAAFGPGGDIGVLFTDKRTGTFQPYFTRLVCTAGN